MDSNDLGHPSGPPCRARLDPEAVRGQGSDLGRNSLHVALFWRIGRGERVKIDTAGSRGVQRCEKKLWMKKKYLPD